MIVFMIAKWVHLAWLYNHAKVNLVGGMFCLLHRSALGRANKGFQVLFHFNSKSHQGQVGVVFSMSPSLDSTSVPYIPHFFTVSFSSISVQTWCIRNGRWKRNIYKKCRVQDRFLNISFAWCLNVAVSDVFLSSHKKGLLE